MRTARRVLLAYSVAGFALERSKARRLTFGGATTCPILGSHKDSQREALPLESRYLQNESMTHEDIRQSHPHALLVRVRGR